MSKRFMLLAIILATTAGPALGQQAERPPYLDPALPIDQRVDDLAARMTLDEKASQFSSTSPAIQRLQVPAYNWWSEALHGVASQGIATVFPQAIGLGATFNTPLIHQIAVTISTEARAKYHEYERKGQAGGAAAALPGSGMGIRPGPAGLTYWSPNVNIFRDPRWGRGQETYGEDPFLTGMLGTAFVKGLQGDDPKYFKTIATPKHFAVHSGPEPSRHVFDAKVSLHDMEDTYLPAFRQTVIEGKAYSVMCAYNRINGEPACASTFLLGDTLRNAWKFNGYVVSDCGAIQDINRNHKFVKNIEDSAAVSLKRGTDLDCGADTQGYATAMRTGLITPADADINLKRILKARFAMGMFDPADMVPFTKIPFAENDSAANRELARRAARESMVLLKNDGLLPFKSSPKTIAIVGPLADSIPALEGNYNGTSSKYVTPVDGIRAQFPTATVTFVAGTKFLHGPVTIPATAYRTEDGKPGLTGVYFTNTAFSGAPAATRVEARLGAAPGAGFFGGANGLPDAVGTGDYSARWTGTLQAEDSGVHEFAISGAGAVKVWLDGKLVIDDWTDRPMANRFAPQDPAAAAKRATTVTLEKGKAYALKIESFHSAQVVAPPPAGLPPGFGRMMGPMVPTLSWRGGVSDVKDAVAAAEKADVVVAVVGFTREIEGEEMRGRTLPDGFVGGDRTAIDLPKDEQALLEAVKATGKPLVVVLVNGSAISVNWAQQKANAILEAWYPGEEGGTAIAETLAGVNNPAGRLPVTFYKDVKDLPPFEEYAMGNRTYRYYQGQPLYPFGYGLSYSKFAYKAAKLSATTLKAGDDLTMDVDVKNISKKAGDEVVQAYLVFPKLAGAPLKALRAFARVSLKPGETKKVTLKLGARDLSMVNDAGTRLIAAGDYTLFIGGGQPGTGAAGLSVPLKIEGDQKLDR